MTQTNLPQTRRAASQADQPEFTPLVQLLQRFGRWLKEIAPSLLASLSFHACVVAILAAVTLAVAGAGQDQIDAEFNAKVVEGPYGPGGGFHFPGRAMIDRPDSAGEAEFPSSVSDLASLLEPTEPVDVAGVSPGPGEEGLGLEPLGASEVIGIGGGGGGGLSTLGSGLGDGDRPGGGPIGGMWGLGRGERANLVVYILDRSGSMIESFDELRHELKRSVGRLQPGQQFNVLWFSSGRAEELSESPLEATPANKARAFAAIDQIVAAGQTDPTDALKRGFAYRPDIVFFLTDAVFDPQIENLVIRLHERYGSRVHTIFYNYFGGTGEQTRQCRGMLQRIAEACRGEFKEVTIDDIE
jgi:hypothetical protein